MYVTYRMNEGKNIKQPRIVQNKRDTNENYH